MKHPTRTSSDSFSMRDFVELRESDGPTRGRIIATRDDGTWIYVLWQRRQGHDGKVTMQQASELRKLSTNG